LAHHKRKQSSVYSRKADVALALSVIPLPRSSQLWYYTASIVGVTPGPFRNSASA
jgi:hypothetical protein